MSYEIGMQAINLEMPERVGHTEYCSHPLLIKEITGIDPRENGDAWRMFYDKIGMDLIWHTNDGPEWTGRQTNMGHAEFQEGGIDYDDKVSCPFETPEDVLSFDPVKEYGIPDIKERTTYFENIYQNGQASLPNQIFTGGYYKTIFSACIQVFGWDMFLASAAQDYERFDNVMEGFFKISMANFEAWANTTAPVLICHDDIVWTNGPVFHPDWYRKYIFPRYKKLWKVVKDAGKKLLFCSDGNFDFCVDDISEAGADGFIFEPLTDLRPIVQKYGQTKVIVGNVDTRALTFKSKMHIYAEVKRCMDLGKSCPGFFIAVGNHIPYNVPIENALAYFEMVEEMGKR